MGSRILKGILKRPRTPVAVLNVLNIWDGCGFPHGDSMGQHPSQAIIANRPGASPSPVSGRSDNWMKGTSEFEVYVGTGFEKSQPDGIDDTAQATKIQTQPEKPASPVQACSGESSRPSSPSPRTPNPRLGEKILDIVVAGTEKLFGNEAAPDADEALGFGGDAAGSGSGAKSNFLPRVSFDTFPDGEPTINNTTSLTLNAKHPGYTYTRGSRTFMVGVDSNDYSDTALQWMIDELVDDGDEIVCLRVHDPENKLGSERSISRKGYRKEAQKLMDWIQSRNTGPGRKLSIVLEFAIGKLRKTFNQMIKMYQPAMLIVGTRGHSLSGLRGLLQNTGSFSKWCLQKSAVPVVVVKPTEKRLKKKQKRTLNAHRGEYALMLKESGIQVHETAPNSRRESLFEIENGPEVEANAVAAALGFDEPIGDYLPKGIVEQESAVISDVTLAASSEGIIAGAKAVSGVSSVKSADSDSPAVSGDEESEDEDAAGRDFKAQQQRKQEEEKEQLRKEKLHNMEMDEASALSQAAADRKAKEIALGRVTDEDEEDDEDDGEVHNGSSGAAAATGLKRPPLHTVDTDDSLRSTETVSSGDASVGNGNHDTPVRGKETEAGVDESKR